MNEPRASQELVLILQEIGLISTAHDIFVRELPRNHERRTDQERKRYVVHAGQEALGFLTVGPRLSPLRDRITLFHRAYGPIGNEVLGFAERDGIDYLLETYFRGSPALTLLQRPGGTGVLLGVLQKIETAFKKGLKRSTHHAADVELSELFEELSVMPQWTPADKVFLQEIVHPYLKTHIIGSAVPQRRVSNGDFLLRNLLVDESGEFRIVDCEYAIDTHFYAEDWLRLTYWDLLPEKLQAFAMQQVPDREAWSVYLSLKQLLLESRVNLPQKAQADAQHWCREIRRCLVLGEAQARQSFFWPADAAVPPSTILLAQLYWMTDEGWSDKHSVSIRVESGRRSRLVFEVPAGTIVHGLRFDPMNCPGVATISSFQVWSLESASEPLWEGTDFAELQQLLPAADALIDPANDAFRVISLGSDPQLHLNGVGSVAGMGLRIEVVVTYSTDPSSLGVALSKMLPSLVKEGTTTFSALKKAEDAMKQSGAAVQTRLAALEDLVTQAKLDRKLAETEKQLLALQTVLPEREHQLDLVRQTLLDQTRTIDRLELLRDKQQGDLGQFAAEAKSLETHKARLDRELAVAKERILLMSDQAHEMTTANTALRREVAALQESLVSGQRAEVDRAAFYLRVLTGLERRLAASIDEMEALQDRLNAEIARRSKMEHTRSWRWTAWMRRPD